MSAILSVAVDDKDIDAVRKARDELAGRYAELRVLGVSNDVWDAERTARLEAEAWALEAMARVPELLAEQHRLEALVECLCQANGELGIALVEAFALAGDIAEHWPIGLTPPDVAAVHAEQRARAVECGRDPDRTPPEAVVPFDAVLAVARLVEWRRQARELVFRDESGTDWQARFRQIGDVEWQRVEGAHVHVAAERVATEKRDILGSARCIGSAFASTKPEGTA